MNKLRDIMKSKSGFTIIEILIVLSIIGILATITVVGYGAWRHSVLAAAVKSDLNGVSAAMENERTFGNAYPQAIPSTITPSKGVAFNGGGSVDGLTYCVDGISTEDATITYYVASEVKDQGAQEGTCAGRSTLLLPDIPGNLAITSSIGTQVGLSWSNNDPLDEVINYTAQCASDAGYIFGMQQATVTGTTATVADLTPSTTFYCRVKATNNSGSSDWSASVSTDTTSHYGSLAVATSIEGYWTSSPKGFLLEDGSEVSRTIYADLFAVIGTAYGAGDSSTTFNLPDSRGRATVNISADSEFDQMGEKPGSKTEALITAQLPSHQHTGITGQGNSTSFRVVYGAGGSSANNHVLGYVSGTAYADYSDSNYPGSNHTHSFTTNSTGSGQAHNNIQPSIVKLSAIKYAPVDTNAALLPAGASSYGYWTSAPAGHLLEDGSAVSRITYAELFSAIGTTYGAGNGSTTFNLPDSRGRLSVNKGSVVEFDTMGEKTGAKTTALTIVTMPAHDHTGTTGTGNIMFYRLVYGAGGGVAANHMTGWVGGAYTDATSTGYPLAAHTHSFTTVANGSGQGHNEIQPSIVKTSAIKYTAVSGTDSPVPRGTSVQGYWATAPTGYLIENGAAVSRSTYADLFAVIGTAYGAGDGSTTFGLPDSRDRAGVNRSPSDTEFDVLGEKSGSVTEALTVAQMPSHNHVGTTGGGNAMFYRLTYTSGSTTNPVHAMGYNGGPGFADYVDANYPGAYHGHSFTTASVGSGAGHSNLQPSIVKLFVIKY